MHNIDYSREGKIGSFQICFLLVGTIMGPGFASGREIWTYMGVFGSKAYIVLALTILLYLVMCLIAATLSEKLKSDDFETIVTPAGNDRIHKSMSFLLMTMTWSCIINMSAAGGAAAKQQFGLNSTVGGLIIIALVLITVFGDFKRVSAIFRRVMPVLLTIMVVSCFILFFAKVENQGYTDAPAPSRMASHFLVAAVVYISSNIYGTVPICIIAANKSKSRKDTVLGIFMAALFICIVSVLMINITQKDVGFSQAMDMPMLAYTSVVSTPLNVVFSITLITAIYISATSNFYAFTVKITPDSRKKYKMVLAALAGFAVGLFGFKNIVNYMFSIKGYFGIAVLIMLIAHYMLYIGTERKKDIKEETAEEAKAKS